MVFPSPSSRNILLLKELEKILKKHEVCQEKKQKVQQERKKVNAHSYGQWTWCGERHLGHRATHHPFIFVNYFTAYINFNIEKRNLIIQDNFNIIKNGKPFLLNPLLPMLTMKI